MLGNNISHLSFSIKHMSVSFDTSYLFHPPVTTIGLSNRSRISDLDLLPLPCSKCTITPIYKYVN